MASQGSVQETRYLARFKSHHDAARQLKQRFTVEADKTDYVAGVLATPATSPRVLYVHVPFCNKICSFCPFYCPDALKRSEYDQYLLAEIAAIAQQPYLQAPIGAVYFGGGTPTALHPQQLARVLAAIRRSFTLAPGAEFSVETSVSELTDEMLDVLSEHGVNRLSIGVQTFDDAMRRRFRRRGDGSRAIATIERVISRGFANTGIDLIYNYPGQTAKRLDADLDIVLKLGLAGLSFYSLMLHPGTPLSEQLTDEERLSMADTEREYSLFAQIMARLTAGGYSLFELTKLIRDRLDRYDYVRIRHTGGSCIGIGHNAGGNVERYLYHNSVSAPKLSPAAPLSARGRIVAPVYFIFDQLIFDLQRTAVSLDVYSNLLQVSLAELLGPLVSELAGEGLVAYSQSDQTLSLTERGVFWGNNIISDLVEVILQAEQLQSC